LIEIQQRLLDDDTWLLEYMLGDEQSYLWVVSRTEVSIKELPARAQITSAVQRYYDLVTARQPKAGETFQEQQDRANRADTQLAEETSALSQILLGTLTTQLKARRLIIVPDGALQYIPFQALSNVANSGGGTPLNSGAQRPLIMDYEIINEPSASTLALVLSERAGRRPASGSVAVLADPVFDLKDSRLKQSVSSSQAPAGSSKPEGLGRALRDVGVGDAEIPRLLSSRLEADAIMSVVPWRSGLKAVGFQANRNLVTGTDLSQYRIVHFATHALLNDDHPELSGIVLSLVDQQGQRQDGYLRLHDIYNLKLPVELVVLSACQTGLGKDVKGEGLIGLTRGFMYAGASGFVASLWKVDDDATAELMKHFYAAMFQKGLSPAAALREAQLAMRMQPRWQHPFYWAGFVIQGQYTTAASPAHYRVGITVATFGGLVVLLALALIFLSRRRQRERL
jgi:CHAT domain-containing protein